LIFKEVNKIKLELVGLGIGTQDMTLAEIWKISSNQIIHLNDEFKEL